MPRIRGFVNKAPVDSVVAKPDLSRRSAPLALPPTPPKTLTKRKRARSRVTDSDTEDDDRVAELPSSDREHEKDRGRDGNGVVVLGNKKRKTLDAIAEELSAARAGDAFWLGGPSTVASGDDARKPRARPRVRYETRAGTRSPSSSPMTPRVLRRQHTGLASPPPSRRQSTARTRVTRQTPTRASARIHGKLFPERDSPNNPFLSNDSPSNPFLSDDSPGNPFLSDDLPAPATEGEPAPPPEPRTPERFVEKPTMTWVFRGTRVQLANPHYKPAGLEAQTALEDARALLPAAHPDFSPAPSFAPRLLFPEARRRLVRKRAPREPQSPTRVNPRARRARGGRRGGDRGGPCEPAGEAPDQDGVAHAHRCDRGTGAADAERGARRAAPPGEGQRRRAPRDGPGEDRRAAAAGGVVLGCCTDFFSPYAPPFSVPTLLY
ncbi:hypothetical protein WOLCODRAFT_139359, partial [Wolfiporia cocos MD-104 SS10]